MRNPRSLSARILLGATTAVALALLLATSYFAIGEREAVERVFDKQNQTLTDTLAVFVIEQMVSLDYPALEYAIQITAQKHDNINFIEVSHGTQTVAQVGKPDSPGRTFFSDVTKRDGDVGSIGRVKVIFSTKDHEALQADRLRDHLITMLVIFFAMVLSLRWLLIRTVIRPIQALTAQTEQAIAEALPELASTGAMGIDSPDEIQQLDQRFTSLLNGLKSRDEARNQAELALIEHKNDLERLIDERTRALQTAQNEAMRLNRVKSEFLAAASHDLRQPLQAINLFHGALNRTGLNEEQKRVSNYLAQSIDSLGGLLNALLDISRLDSGVVKPHPEVIQAESFLRKIDAEFSALATRKSLRFKLYFPFNELSVKTDPNLLLSLLSNLVGNAVKYTDRGGVLVGIRRRGKDALIQVWDTGIGISPEHVDHIYEEYFQIGNRERDRSKGLGLGLSIVKRLAVLLETEVHCHSRRGRGTVFEFRLPLAIGQTAADKFPLPQISGDAGDLTRLAGRRVVVVEDDLMVARAVALALEARGMIVSTCGSAEEALTQPGILAADFYLSDFRLPGMDGLQFLATLQQRTEVPLKAILLTGDTSPDRIKLLQSSRWTVLFKPADVPRLLTTLASLDAASDVREQAA